MYDLVGLGPTNLLLQTVDDNRSVSYCVHACFLSIPFLEDVQCTECFKINI